MKNSNNLTVEILTGKQIIPVIPEVAKLRIKMFREFPYLYEGGIKYKEYEEKYLTSFIETSHALLVTLKDGNTIGGVATALPFISAGEHFVEVLQKFREQGLNPKDYFYIGDVIVLPEYQGQRFSVISVEKIENLARQWGYKHACLMTVMRDKNDPRRPKNYKDTDGIWAHLGYEKIDIIMNSVYPTIQANGNVKEVPNPMRFWVKKLLSY